MKKFKIYLIFALLAGLFQTLSAQNYRLQGVVCDTANGQKIFYATVGLTNTDSTLRNVAVTYS